MSKLFPRESAIVLSILLAVTFVAGVLRFTHRDLIALFDRPSQEEIAAGEQALDQLEARAEALDPSNLIAAVAPCSRWRGFAEACVTVTERWQLAPNRLEIAAQLWKTWAEICTSKHVAGEQEHCFLQLRSAEGEVLGGSARRDASKIWLRK